MRIVCYGDSNTYGWDPRSFSGNRYSNPWPELVARATGWVVKNCGEPGRVVPFREEHLEWFCRDVEGNDPDLLIIMLGTNDLFFSLEPAAEAIAGRMRAMIQYALKNRLARKIWLLSCPQVAIPEERYLPVLEDLSRRYRRIAAAEQIGFADPYSWNIPMAFDGVHFTEEGHRIFAENISRRLITDLRGEEGFTGTVHGG